MLRRADSLSRDQRGFFRGVHHPEWVVIAALIVSSPMIPGLLAGQIGPFTALLRFLGALLLCWLGAMVLTAVTGRYADMARRAELMAAIEAARKQREEMVAEAEPAPGPVSGKTRSKPTTSRDTGSTPPLGGPLQP